MALTVEMPASYPYSFFDCHVRPSRERRYVPQPPPARYTPSANATSPNHWRTGALTSSNVTASVDTNSRHPNPK